VVTGVWDESRGKTLPVRGRGHQKYIRRPTGMANDSVMSAGFRKPEIASYALTLSNILDAKSMFPHRTHSYQQGVFYPDQNDPGFLLQLST
jgi:hypothetical protein